MSLSVDVIEHIRDIDASSWDALAGDDNPFVEHAFLHALEESKSVGPRTGWLPCHVVVRDQGKLVGAMPCYEKTDSYGEYIFDWSWAQAAQRSRVRYYPKLTCAIPFVPATGPRLLARDDDVRRALVRGVLDLARDRKCSSTHVLFCRNDEGNAFVDAGFRRRASLQFHWRNDNYESFDAFLEKLQHEDRKQIKRERRRVNESGVTIEVHNGTELNKAQIDDVFRLYTSISDRKWGRPYLTRTFFDIMPKQRALIVLAKRDDEIVAMTISFEKGKHIYGRHWGTSVDVPGLHFELCYYQLLDRAIANKCTLVEAGAQGEHKLKRAFLPVITHSMHHFVDKGFGDAVYRFLDEERAAVVAERDELRTHSPYKAGMEPKRDLVAGIDDL